MCSCPCTFNPLIFLWFSCLWLYQQGTTSNNQIRGAPTSGHSDRTVVPTAAVEPSPTNAPNNRERRAAAPEQPPMHASSHRISNAGVRGHHHQSGRFVPHTHGRGGEGFNGGRGSRRPEAGGSNGRGNANANGSPTYLNRGGGRHGQEHRGGFNRQPRGRDHEDGHTPLGSSSGICRSTASHASTTIAAAVHAHGSTTIPLLLWTAGILWIWISW